MARYNKMWKSVARRLMNRHKKEQYSPSRSWDQRSRKNTYQRRKRYFKRSWS